MDNIKSTEVLERKLFERELHIKPDHTVSLNFKVSFEFRQAFKLYAISNGLSMRELLIRGFELAITECAETADMKS